MRSFLTLKIYGVLAVLVLLGACKPAPKKPKAKAGSAGLTQTCNAAVGEALGVVPVAQVGLSELSLSDSSVEVSSSSLSTDTPSTQISVDFTQVGNENTDISPTFMMWKACQSGGKDCVNNGEFKRAYTYTVSKIPGLPKGQLEVSVKLCVDDLKYITAADQVKAKNGCSASEPCYCGTEYKVRYMNNDDSSKADKNFQAALETYNMARDRHLGIAQNYVKTSRAYVAACEGKDNSPLLQYAKNVGTFSPSEIALYSESYGDVLASLFNTQTQGSGLQLADASAAACDALADSGGGSGSGNDAAGEDSIFDSLFGGGSSTSGSGSGSESPSGSAKDELASGGAGGEKPAGSDEPAVPADGVPLDDNLLPPQPTQQASSGMGTGTAVTIGLGIGVAVFGVVMLANYGIKSQTGTGLQDLIAFKVKGVTSLQHEIKGLMAQLADDAGKTEDNAKKLAKAFEAKVELNKGMLTDLEDNIKKLEDKKEKTESKSLSEAEQNKLDKLKSAHSALEGQNKIDGIYSRAFKDLIQPSQEAWATRFNQTSGLIQNELKKEFSSAEADRQKAMAILDEAQRLIASEEFLKSPEWESIGGHSFVDIQQRVVSIQGKDYIVRHVPSSGMLEFSDPITDKVEIVSNYDERGRMSEFGWAIGGNIEAMINQPAFEDGKLKTPAGDIDFNNSKTAFSTYSAKNSFANYKTAYKATSSTGWKAGIGMAVIGGLIGIGTAATALSEAVPCGGYAQIIKGFEPQLYTQAQSVHSSWDALLAAQAKAASTP